jgi:glyoxylase-like metal-dependent hydrolase (beta-lactamase superfamily II)/rhodanese-related sulfurtransferase
MTTRKAWSPKELHRHLDKESPFTILDVRSKDEFDAWQIEGKKPIPTINLPYFDFLDLENENEEIAAVVARTVPGKLKDKLPKRGQILAVCAKGDTSSHVAEGLRRLGYQAVNLEGGMAAWGDHYEIRAVEENERFTLLQISRPARGCLSYMLAGGGNALVVDAGRHIDVYTHIAKSRGWQISDVLDTHLQADHLSGGTALARKLGVNYWLHPYDGIHPGDMLPAAFNFHFLQDGTLFQMGEVNVRAMHLPGHTLGMVNPLVDGRYLLSGDTLFIDSIGRPDLGGQAEAWSPLLFRSLNRILELPERTEVLPAHFGHPHEADDAGHFRARIAALRDHHEGLRILSKGPAAFTKYVLEHLPEYPATYDEVRRVNTGLLQPDEARASELELGPNRCALSQRKTDRRLAA